MRSPKVRKILLVASEGGHWVQLLRLRPAFVDFETTYLTTNEGLRVEVGDSAFYSVIDANLTDKLRLLRLALEVFWVLVKVRPHLVLSTGAAPGFFAIFWGKLFGARTIWIDSIANSETLSSAGVKVRRFADRWLTQWPELASDAGPEYRGNVL